MCHPYSVTVTFTHFQYVVYKHRKSILTSFLSVNSRFLHYCHIYSLLSRLLPQILRVMNKKWPPPPPPPPPVLILRAEAYRWMLGWGWASWNHIREFMWTLFFFLLQQLQSRRYCREAEVIFHGLENVLFLTSALRKEERVPGQIKVCHSSGSHILRAIVLLRLTVLSLKSQWSFSQMFLIFFPLRTQSSNTARQLTTLSHSKCILNLKLLHYNLAVSCTTSGLYSFFLSVFKVFWIMRYMSGLRRRAILLCQTYSETLRINVKLLLVLNEKWLTD